MPTQYYKFKRQHSAATYIAFETALVTDIAVYNYSKTTRIKTSTPLNTAISTRSRAFMACPRFLQYIR